MSHTHPLYSKRLHFIARRRWAIAARKLRSNGNLMASHEALALALEHARLAQT